MRYAVIKTGGKQYKVSEGDVIEVERITGKEISFDVLLYSNDNEVKIGNPLVKNAQVKGSILEEKKDVKVRVSKYKAKSKYRRNTGFRKIISKVKIDKINI